MSTSSFSLFTTKLFFRLNKNIYKIFNKIMRLYFQQTSLKDLRFGRNRRKRRYRHQLQGRLATGCRCQGYRRSPRTNRTRYPGTRRTVQL